MTADANIKRIGELSAYANHLQGFCESMTKNGTALSNVMAQKLEELRKKYKQMQELYQSLRKEEMEANNALAYLSDGHPQERAELNARYTRLNDKVVHIRKLLGDLNSQVGVANGAVRCIIEDTKAFQNEIRLHTERGRTLLKNSATQLTMYQENLKKI